MRKKRGYLLFVGALLLVAAGIVAAAGWTAFLQNKVQRQVDAEFAGYEQAANADGIVVETPDPYFIKKQTGYTYRAPETIRYDSAVTGGSRQAMVFLPADYDEKKSYPVLYLLHGYGGSHRTWKNKHADVILQNLYYFEGVPEMIVVCPNCNVNEKNSVQGLDTLESTKAFDGTTQDLVTSLMPFIRQHYSIKEGRDNTAIAGNSMGGRNALYAGYTYPDRFGYIGSFSSGPLLEGVNNTDMIPGLMTDLKLPEGAQPFSLLLLMVGRSDEMWKSTTYELHAYMEDNGIDHIFYDTEGGHQTTVWQNGLYNFARKLFR